MSQYLLPVSALLTSAEPITPPPVKQLAALLLDEARAVHGRGRDPRVLSADLASGDVARRLGADIDALAAALRQLAEIRLVAPTADGGLQLCDLQALARLALSGPGGGSELPRAA